MDQFHQRIQQHDDGQIIGDLLVVGFDLQAQGQAEEGGPQHCFRKSAPEERGFSGCICPYRVAKRRIRRNLFPPEGAAIGEHHGGQHPGHEGDGLHLGVVSHLDNLEVIAAEGDGYGPAYGHRQAYPEGQHQEKSTQQRDEQVSGRTFSDKKQVVDGLRPVSAVLGRDGRGGHAAEHGICPVCGVVRMCLVPLVHLVRHPDITGYVALVHNLTLQHLRHESITQGKEQGHDARSDSYLFPIFFHFVSVSNN